MKPSLQPQNSVGKILTERPNNVTSKELVIYNASLTEKKLGDFDSDEELLLMNSYVIRWATNIGIPLPDKDQVNAISNFLKDNFKNFNATDVDRCVEMISLDELEFPDKDNHYGKLSFLYVAKALKAYQAHRSKILFKVREQIEKQELLKHEMPSDKEQIDTTKALIKYAKETVDDGKMFIDLRDILFNFLWKNDLVPKPISDDLQNEAREFGIRAYKADAEGTGIKSAIVGTTLKKVNKKEIQMKYSRQFLTNRWLREIDIKKIIKSVTIEMIKKANP